MKLKSLIALLLMLVAGPSSIAALVTFTWEHDNPEGTLAGWDVTVTSGGNSKTVRVITENLDADIEPGQCSVVVVAVGRSGLLSDPAKLDFYLPKPAKNIVVDIKIRLTGE